MKDKDLTLVEIIRNPRLSVCEAGELTRDGHYYLYHYNGMEGSFYRATIPSGAADIHFRMLKPSDKVPVGGWQLIEINELCESHLKLVTK